MTHIPLKRGLHKQIVDALGLQIVGGKIAVGDTLPTADDLSLELGVSRTVAREAIKVLEEKGLVESRPKTGIQVQPAQRWRLLDRDIMLWQYQTGPRAEFLQSLVEVRAVIEPAAAALAAERRTDDDLARMETAYQRLIGAVNDLSAYKEADRAFHTAIFDASRNPLLIYLAQTVNLDLDAGRDLTARVPRSLVEVLPLHGQLVGDIRQQDAAAAHQTSVELVNQIAGYYEELSEK